MTGRAGTPRRTQRERREATVGKLVDATIAAIAEVGYSRTSVQEICGRAGLSHGGMFRHFDTRLDLIVRAAEEVGRRQIRSFTDRFEQLPAYDANLASALRVARDASRDPINAVWYELLVAARTDEQLRDRLGPTFQAYRAALYAAALRVPVMTAFPDDLREALLFTVRYAFDGETLTRPVAQLERDEAQRLDLMQRCLARFTG